ncbi:hypothetical protein A5885_002246 [Enterococcus sp. 8E11_MSG4843]|nr:hypothetical protein A5885_002246 [Enterococcus sp. 8E11_MSG4843]
MYHLEDIELYLEEFSGTRSLFFWYYGSHGY